MNKLVLIGNGFDLAHNLKTRYNDFLLWYLQLTLETLVNKLQVSDELLSSNIDFIEGNPPKPLHSIKEFHDFLNLYNIKFEYKNRFFKELLGKTSELNWVDIEYEYYTALIEFFEQIENNRLGSYLWWVEKEVKKLNVCFNAIKEKLEEYLLTIEGADLKVNADIAKHFIKEFGNHQRDPYEKIVFLNFNYTSTVEKYFDVISRSSNVTVNYIHGKLNDTNNPIIFGYGDEMDIYYPRIERLNSNEFLKNFKSFGYFKTNNYQELTKFIDSDKFQVYIMGHSCGISDRVLLNYVFEHNNCNRIKIYYHKKSSFENDYFEKTQEISRHFSPELKGKMRKLIVPFPKSVPLVDIKDDR